MSADVKTVSGEVQGLRQQLEDFGTHLDGVKRRIAAPEKQPTPPSMDLPLAHKGATRLTNNGPLLCDLPSTAAMGVHTAPSSTKEIDERTSGGDYIVRPRCHDFPRFQGATPLLWIDLCLTYFEMYKVPKHHWMSSATLHLDGHAAL
jgi:hypothetical protein